MSDYYQQNNPIAPPQDIEAEQACLGAVLLTDNALISLEEEGLTPEHFYREHLGVIYREMLALQATGAPVDALTLCDWLNQKGLMHSLGGPAQVELLAGSVPAVGNLRQYARIVIRKAVARWRLLATYDQQNAIWADDEDGWVKAIAAADGAALAGKRDTLIEPKEDFLKWYAGTQGWSTPYPKLTKALGGGLVPGDITVIGAWPGFGKTVLCDSFVYHAHKEEDARCHILLNELNSGIRSARMLARMTSVDWQKIRDRNLTKEEFQLCVDAFEKFPAKYERCNGWKIDDYVRHLRRKKWDIAVIDSASRIPNRDTHDLEQVVGALADVAADVGTHLILVVQLNLERCKQLERPMPLGRDLLGGGSWFRDARNILFIHREQQTITVNGQEKAVPTAAGTIYADKATHGEPEKSLVDVRFNSNRMTFDETGGDTPAVERQTSYVDEFDDPGMAQTREDKKDDQWAF